MGLSSCSPITQNKNTRIHTQDLHTHMCDSRRSGPKIQELASCGDPIRSLIVDWTPVRYTIVLCASDIIHSVLLNTDCFRRYSWSPITAHGSHATIFHTIIAHTIISCCETLADAIMSFQILGIITRDVITPTRHVCRANIG